MYEANQSSTNTKHTYPFKTMTPTSIGYTFDERTLPTKEVEKRQLLREIKKVCRSRSYGRIPYALDFLND